MGIYDELSKLSESPTPLPPPDVKPQPEKKVTYRREKSSSNRDTTTPSNHATMQPGTRDTTTARAHDDIVELVRKAVKEFGKEGATHRFTVEEKKAIGDIIYAYKGRDLRTNENEITRIAVNFIVCDYQENGENSVLDTVLRALNR